MMRWWWWIFSACKDFFLFIYLFFVGGRLTIHFPLPFFFLKLEISWRTHRFHALGHNSPQWLSELRRLWPSVPRQVACELVSLIGSHTTIRQHSQATATTTTTTIIGDFYSASNAVSTTHVSIAVCTKKNRKHNTPSTLKKKGVCVCVWGGGGEQDKNLIISYDSSDSTCDQLLAFSFLSLHIIAHYVAGLGL